MSRSARFVEVKFKPDLGRSQNVGGFVCMGDYTIDGVRTLVFRNPAYAEKTKAAKKGRKAIGTPLLDDSQKSLAV